MIKKRTICKHGRRTIIHHINHTIHRIWHIKLKKHKVCLQIQSSTIDKEKNGNFIELSWKQQVLVENKQHSNGVNSRDERDVVNI